MSIFEKASYLRGLAEGMEYDFTTGEGKLFKGILELLDEMADSISRLESFSEEINSELDEVAEEFVEIEETIDDIYDILDGCDCDFPQGDGCLYDVECPSCGEHITLDNSLLELGETKCPGCGENLEFDLDESECGCEDCEV